MSSLANNPNGLFHIPLVGMDYDKQLIPIMRSVAVFSWDAGRHVDGVLIICRR